VLFNQRRAGAKRLSNSLPVGCLALFVLPPSGQRPACAIQRGGGVAHLELDFQFQLFALGIQRGLLLLDLAQLFDRQRGICRRLVRNW
jgi:hypothetical protein